MVDLSTLTTEQRNPNTMDLDRMSPLDIARAMNHEDSNAVKAVEKVLPEIARAIEWAAETVSSGGRLIYIGAGTSGRLGLLDAVECPPTFGVNPNTVVGIIAGGGGAYVNAMESAEDKTEKGRDDLIAEGVSDADMVVGIAASGRTPYVIGALEYARCLGCKTVSISCVPNSKIGAAAELSIEAVTGPEVLTGSTRLKAGTAQKLILNMISTGSMVLSGKAYQNLMVDMKQSNEKLRARGLRIVMEATGCDENRAAKALDEADGSVKLALTSILLDEPVADAKRALDAAGGHVRRALEAARG